MSDETENVDETTEQAAAEETPAKKPARRRAPAKPKAEGEAKKAPARGRASAKKTPEPAAEAESAPAAKAEKAEKPARADKPAARPASRRRGAAAAPVAPVIVRAQARYVRSSARKARLVCDHIRGKSVLEARAILAHSTRAVARDWQRLLDSAVANAENNHELDGDDLRIKAVHADEGPTLKRFRPRAMGRATRIRKRTSHLTILLTPKE
jgi:ribosomal protein L22